MGRSPLSGTRLESRLVGAFFIALALMPIFVRDDYVLFIGTQLWVYFAVALGLNFLTGFGGQTSIGHGALVAIGAYITALGMVDYHLSFWTVLPLAVVGTALGGALMAIPAFRVSTWYFALITLAFATVLQGLLVEWQGLTHGFAGVTGIPMPRIGAYEFTSRDLYWLVLGFCALGLFLMHNLVHSRYGRALQALRDNPLAALGNGVSLVRLKLFAFVWSALMAGAAGAFFAVQKTVITPEDFSGDMSMFFLLVIVLGGLGRLHGALLGTIAFFLLPELLQSLQSWRMLIYGAALLVLIRFMPEGIAGGLARFWKKASAVTLPVVAQEPIPRLKGAHLQVRNVKKRFGGVFALRDVSIDVPAGHIHAIVGPNGSGKTTLLNVITRFYPADGGSVRVDGADVGRLAPERLARSGIRRTFQTPKLVPGLSVIENVMLGAYASQSTNLAQVALDLPSARREREQLTAEALRYLSFVGLRDVAGTEAGEVPHGQQRLAEIARALVGRPQLLLLDEPAAGLSMTELDGLCRLIEAISKSGTTVLIVEHHLDLVAKLATAVTVLDQGAVLAEGPPDVVFKNKQVLSAYMGGRAVDVEPEKKIA
ncbi:branched-chain amino acid ABC transporter ATP-binding protein/permease [Variovorax sp. PBL-E5]|uniref:branched-chain amino acid ABC transporter ATP-binding protein/permease n=1 Tax=Variovorax sp. PBL-E5 TaxID=434014 RepID=UPI001319B457|nr:branched-chain amino acid ABC transporter ATP-binding protein/permease [Variovorax sp. PBL-E5]VTU39997.1 Glutamine transport ATP-binding protein GlnQ [Variovorax sp. PBL-E5]